MTHTLLLLAIFLLTGCTTGSLNYTNAAGETRRGCDVEFTGAPSVDKFAVDYALSFCAKNFIEKGYTIADDKRYLLSLNTAIPQPPCGEKWQHSLAEHHYRRGHLSKRDYGYIVAHIDLGLATINTCQAE